MQLSVASHPSPSGRFLFRTPLPRPVRRVCHFLVFYCKTSSAVTTVPFLLASLCWWSRKLVLGSDSRSFPWDCLAVVSGAACNPQQFLFLYPPTLYPSPPLRARLSVSDHVRRQSAPSPQTSGSP